MLDNLLIWVAQTVWLTFSSILRLDLYIDSYGLTRLRLSAAIWMGLVLAGLILTLWQIGRSETNMWLINRVSALGAVVLYLCCFVSFDATIARYNLASDAKPDRFYLCYYLGEAAAPALTAASPNFCNAVSYNSAMQVSEPDDWREWGFRNARVRRSLAAMQAKAVSP